MRDDYQRERTSVLTWLISAMIGGYVVQLLLTGPWFRNDASLTAAVALSIPALKAGWIWTLLTYPIFHDPHFYLHVIGNVFVLYLLGRELLPMLGTKRFLGLFAVATLVGGLTWTAVHWRLGGGHVLLGATPAIDALFIVFACFFPNQEMNFLLLFLFPVTLRPKYLAAALVIFDLCGLLFWELSATTMPFDASSAHLGGMLTGFVFYRFIYDTPWFNHGRRTAEIELPRWLKRAKKAPQTVAPVYHVNMSTPEDLRAEVDRILDKINSQGFRALTPDEKRILDEARDAMSRR